MRINNLRDLWIKNGQLTKNARELFYLAGRELDKEPLSDSASTTYFWRSAPENERWDLLKAAPSHIAQVISIATELGMHEPWLREETSPTADMVVVLPDDYRGIFHRMWFGLREMRGVNHLLLLTSLRPATQEEIDTLCSHKLMPPLSLHATEATMAQLALSRAVFEESTHMRSILSVPNINGNPANLEVMIANLLRPFEEGGDFTFVIHQPKISTAIQVERALIQNKFTGQANYIAAGPLSSTRAADHENDNTYACTLLDEACSVIHELAMLEQVCA